jgi:hypothetical protein
MRCLSCQNEVASKDAKLVLKIVLCPSCAAMAEKAEKELDREVARAAETAKATLAEHILKGGLFRTKEPPLLAGTEEPDGPPTKRLGVPK